MFPTATTCSSATPRPPKVRLYNAINATRSLVIPVEPSAKGRASVEGLEGVVAGMEESLGFEVGVLAAVPTGFKNTKGQQKMLAELEYDAPVVGDWTSLMEGCWEQQCSAFTYVWEHRERRRDYEIETLAQLDELARHLEATVGIEAQNPPELGDVDHGLEVTR